MTAPTDTELDAVLAEHLRSRADHARPMADPGPRILSTAGELRRRRQRARGVLVAAALVFAACVGIAVAAQTSTSNTSQVSAGTGTTVPSPFEYRASGVLLAVDGQPLRLCLAGAPNTADGKPNDEFGIPRCGFGVPVAGVDLRSAPGVRTVHGNTFSTGVRLVGAWDGTTFTAKDLVVDNDPGPPWPPVPIPPVPCPTPAGGWPPLPPNVDASQALGALLEYGTAAHGDTFAGTWLSSSGDEVQVMAFTDDPANHQADLDAIYPRVCVVRGTRTYSSIQATVMDSFTASLPHGSKVLGAGMGFDPDLAAGPMITSLDLTVDDPDVRAAVHALYGDAAEVHGGLIVGS